MTTRERNLSILLVTALLFVVVLASLKWLKQSSQQLEEDIKAAEVELKDSEIVIVKAEGEAEFIEFLNRHEPQEPRSPVEVENELRSFCDSKLNQNGLVSTKSQRLSEPAPGRHYSRKRVSLFVRGDERNLVSFLTQLTNPKEFRSVTRLSVAPTAGDETNTKVDAIVEVDQWFIAKKSDTFEDLPEEQADPAAPAEPPAPSPELPPGLNAAQP